MTTLLWTLTLWVGSALCVRVFIQNHLAMFSEIQIFFLTSKKEDDEMDDEDAEELGDILDRHGFGTILSVSLLAIMIILFVLTLPLQRILDRQR